MIFGQQVETSFDAYLKDHPDDENRLMPLHEALCNQGDAVTSRKDFRAHVTVTAVVFNEEGYVLLANRRGLDRWAAPGGHLEADDESLIDAALRQLAEATGIDPRSVVPLADVPIDIDILYVPENVTAAEPAHRHFDFRYAFRTAVTALVHESEEARQVAWRPANCIEARRLRVRAAAAAVVWRLA